MENLINYLKHLNINKNNIKNIFHKLNADLRILNINFEKDEELASIKILLEDLDILCGVLETDDRELNDDEKLMLIEEISNAIIALEKRAIF